MDTVKLEAKWPPDRKSTIDASEFGIYKEPANGKRLRGTDVATGCLLVLSLIAAAAVVLYFTLFDYTIPTTQALPSSAGPLASYAKYVKDKQTVQAANSSAAPVDYGLLAAVLSVKNAENLSAPANDANAEKRIDDSGGNDGSVATGHLKRTVRLFPGSSPRRPARVSHGTATSLGFDDGMYGFGRRSDFPQLAAYRAPFPPKSVLDVMKYVTGTPDRPRAPPEYMVAQESKRRYAPIRPADEVNRFLPDAGGPPHGGSKRFRNRFGPPVILTPPAMTRLDDFMKPPSPGARYSMDFDGSGPGDVVPSQEVSSSVQSHTDVVFHSPVDNNYPVPDTPSPKRVKNKKTKSKKPISVMLDIYPITNHDRDNDQEDEEELHDSELFTSLKNNIRQSDRDNLFFRLNLFPKFSEGGRRISKQQMEEKQIIQKPMIHLTTKNPSEDEDNNGNEEDGKSAEYEYSSESKTHNTIMSNDKN